MADKRISELNNSTLPLGGDELVPIVQNGETKKISVSSLVQSGGAVENSYNTIAEMLADQANQTQGNIQFVEDASADPDATYDYAYYDYLATNLGTLDDYRLLSPEEVTDFVISTAFNDVKLAGVVGVNILETEENSVSFREDDGDITEIIFNQVFSKYLQAFTNILDDKNLTIKLFNKTNKSTLIGEVESIVNNTVVTNVYTKFYMKSGMALNDTGLGDVFSIDLDLGNKKDNIQNVNTYEDIPSKSGVYVITQSSNINTDVKYFEDNSTYNYNLQNKFVKREYFGFFEDDYIFLDEVWDYSNFIGSIELYGSELDNLFSSNLKITNNAIPKNCYKNIVNQSRKIGVVSIELKQSHLTKEGLIKFPYNINFNVLNSNLIINEKSVSHEFVFLSDSVNETVTTYIRLLDGFDDDNSFLLNKNLRLKFEFEDNNQIVGYEIQSFEPITKEFTTDGSGLIINDTTLTHSNQIKLWVQEYINNNLTGTPPTIIGYENLDVSLKVGQNQYRIDTMYRNNSDLVCSALSVSFDRFKLNDQNKDIFKVIALGSNTLERLDRTTAEDDFLADVVMVTSRAETDNDGTDPLGASYGFGVEFNEPTRDADLAANGMTDTQASDNHEQSPATAIVTAKFKWLRNETGAPWGLIREACRATASNANNYNIYRGFGKIDTAAAKTYIENNIDTWTGVNTTELAEYYDAISPYNTAVTLEEKTDKTPVVKKDLKNFRTLVFGGINQWSLNANGNFFKPNQNQGYNNAVCNVDSNTQTPLDVIDTGTSFMSSFCRVFEDGYKLKKIQLSGAVTSLTGFRMIVVSAKRVNGGAFNSSAYTDKEILYDNTFTTTANTNFNYDIDVDVSVDASEVFVFYAYVSGGSTILFATRTDLVFQK